jgi:hypothetical protein
MRVPIAEGAGRNSGARSATNQRRPELSMAKPKYRSAGVPRRTGYAAPEKSPPPDRGAGGAAGAGLSAPTVVASIKVGRSARSWYNQYAIFLLQICCRSSDWQQFMQFVIGARQNRPPFLG